MDDQPDPGIADRQLWHRVRRGHTRAFDELFIRHHERILNFSFRRTADWGVAEDVMSATFMELWRSRARLDIDGESAAPLLYGIATNLMRGHRRKLRLHAKLLEEATNGAHIERSRTRFTDRDFEEIDYLTQVGDALSKLRPRHREAFALQVFGELSIAEIAEALGVSPGTAGTWVHRARQKLAEHPLFRDSRIAQQRGEHGEKKFPQDDMSGAKPGVAPLAAPRIERATS